MDRAPARPWAAKYGAISMPAVITRAAGNRIPNPPSRVAIAAGNRDASLVHSAHGWPRRSSSVISSAAPGRAPSASLRTP